MFLKELFEKQKELDRVIMERCGDVEFLTKKKIMAFKAEMAELGNEVPEIFKFWKENHGKDQFNREAALEEFTDGLHFLLSIGIDLDYMPDSVPGFDTEVPLFVSYFWVDEAASKFADRMDPGKLKWTMELFFHLGKALRFSDSEIKDQYLAKNEVNHKRQANGY